MTKPYTFRFKCLRKRGDANPFRTNLCTSLEVDVKFLLLRRQTEQLKL